MKLHIVVSGCPVAKSRPRFRRAGTHVMTYTPAKTKQYESRIADAVKEEIEKLNSKEKAMLPLDCPVSVEITAYTHKPKHTDRPLPIVKPDLDNYIKSALDGINNTGLWTDDARVVNITARKEYPPHPDDERLVIDIKA